ncbi:MAG TPA: hypothetical protein ENH31_08415 [Nitrospirae bacterium]|nr:hypothetical protein [Nitrospirota bacterium]
MSKKTPSFTTGGKAATEMIPAGKNIMNYASIVEKNPFGAPMEFHPMISSQGSSEKPESPSDLILVGTVTGPDNLSYAIFMDKSRPEPVRQEVFSHGGEVYNYGTLMKIERTEVEIRQGANIHTIQIRNISDIEPKNLRSAVSSGRHPGFARKVRENQYVLDQRRVQTALRNPRQIMTDARLYPNIVDGKQEGFRILEVKPGGIYESLGLRNNDILLRINGLDLSSPEAAVQTMSALKGMKTVNLDIIRNGSRMTMDYQMK